MGGKDDDGRSDLDKWLNSQKVEIDKVRQQFRDGIDKELRSWTHDSDSSSLPVRGPFERFKTFVDSNFSTFANGFRNFPSNVSELKAKMQEEREARRRDELDIWRAWTGSEDSADHIKMQVERQSTAERKEVESATFMLLRESYERNRHVSPLKIWKLYNDKETKYGVPDPFATPMLSMGGACYYKIETLENLPSTARWSSLKSSTTQWLSVDWFKRNPYSPIRLETHPDLGETGINWRAAFEDLLCATLDKPMVSEERVGQRQPWGKPQSTYYGPGLDWMLSLQCRGILPPQLPSLYRIYTLGGDHDEMQVARSSVIMRALDIVTSNQAHSGMAGKPDISALMDEIAIKSGPQTEAKPLKVVQTPWRAPKIEQGYYDTGPEADYCKTPQSPWQVPETEQELYDNMPPFTDLVKSPLPSISIPFSSVTELLRESRGHAEAMTAAVLENDYEKFKASFLEIQAKDKTGLITGMDIPEAELRKIFQKTRGFYQLFGPSSPSSSNTSSATPEEVTAARAPVVPSPVSKQDTPVTQRFPTETMPSRVDSGERPDILSQMTTTHTTRKPDGSVITKVTLKHSFADGTEETHESVQTTHGETPISRPVVQEGSIEQPREKKSGWFWN